MKIVAIGNIYNNLDTIKLMREDVVEADLVLLTGSITDHGGWKESRNVIEALSNLNSNILSVMGSSDSKEVSDYLESINISLHGNGHIIDNIGIYGIGGGNRTLFNRPTEFSEKELNYHLEQGYKIVRGCEFIILITHLPPYNSKLDKTAKGDHVGSIVLRSFMFKHPPKVFVTSKIYGKTQKDRLGPTHMVACESLNMGGYVLIDTLNKDNYIITKNVND